MRSLSGRRREHNGILEAALIYIVSASSLNVPAKPANRRAAVFGGAALVGSLAVTAPPAHADDDIETIAARANAAAQKSRAAKEKAKQGNALLDAAGSGLNVVLTGAVLLFIGGAGAFVASLDKSGIALGGEEERRDLTEAEKRKYANLSPKEKRELGIKGL